MARSFQQRTGTSWCAGRRGRAATRAQALAAASLCGVTCQTGTGSCPGQVAGSWDPLTQVTARLPLTAPFLLGSDSQEAQPGRCHVPCSHSAGRPSHVAPLSRAGLACCLTKAEFGARTAFWSCARPCSRCMHQCRYIEDLQQRGLDWREVYWRLWAVVIVLFCQTCLQHFPARELECCCCHHQLPVYTGGQRSGEDPAMAACLPASGSLG